METALADGSVPLPMQALLDGSYDNSYLPWFRLASQNLFEAEKMLGQLANPEVNRFITRDELTRTFNDITTVIIHAGE